VPGYPYDQIDEDDVTDQLAMESLAGDLNDDPSATPPSELLARDVAPSSPILPDPQKIAQVRAQRDSAIANAGIGSALTQIGAGLAGQKADVSGFDMQKALAQKKADEAISDTSNNAKRVADFIKQKQAQAKLEQTDKRLGEQEKHNQKNEDQRGEYLKILSNRNKSIEEQKQMARDDIAHRMNVRQVKTNPLLRQRVTQYQNLGNALSNFVSAEHQTPQQVDELQQAIRSNLGIKGQSGVDERAHTMINTLGLDAKRLQQFLTGAPADVAKDSALIKHLTDLGRLEQGNIQRQYGKLLGGLTAGHGSIYDRRPDLRHDIEGLVGGMGSIFDDSQPQQPPAGNGQQVAPPQNQAAPIRMHSKSTGKYYLRYPDGRTIPE